MGFLTELLKDNDNDMILSKILPKDRSLFPIADIVVILPILIFYILIFINFPIRKLMRNFLSLSFYTIIYHINEILS